MTSLVVLPLILVSLGALDPFINKVFSSLNRFGRRLVLSLLTVFFIESVLVLILTLINNPWDSVLAQFWWEAFSRSPPIGLLIGLFMGFYLKPKMDQMRRVAN